jgi:hypothetical protein
MTNKEFLASIPPTALEESFLVKALATRLQALMDRDKHPGSGNAAASRLAKMIPQ